LGRWEVGFGAVVEIEIGRAGEERDRNAEAVTVGKDSGGSRVFGLLHD